MPESLPLLESRRAELLHALGNLKDMRPGSVVGAVSLWKTELPLRAATGSGARTEPRLTYKWNGKTVTEALPTAAAVRKAEREIAEFRQYQRLGRELVEVNEKICRLRPIEEPAPSEQEKNGGRHPAGSRTGNRAAAADHLHQRAQNGPCGSGGHRNARALGHASGRSHRLD